MSTVGDGEGAEAGDTTWNYVAFSSTLWSVAGGEFDSAVSGSGTASKPETYVELAGPGIAADIQSWLAQPGTNFGWAFLLDETITQDAKRFYSSESTDGPRPALRIEYHVDSGVLDWSMY